MREMKYDVLSCPSGSAVVVECDGSIRQVLLLESGKDPDSALLEMSEKGILLKKGKLERRLYEWFEAYERRIPPGKPTFRLEPDGTEFQLRVWRRTLEIPFGDVLTYGQMAADIGCASAQAIGQALGRNPIPLIIPCHRIIAAGMNIGGFTGGLSIKTALLKHEGWTIRNGAISRW